MNDFDMILKVIGTLFLIAGAFNANIPRTNSIGVGLSLWGIVFLA